MAQRKLFLSSCEMAKGAIKESVFAKHFLFAPGCKVTGKLFSPGVVSKEPFKKCITALDKGIKEGASFDSLAQQKDGCPGLPGDDERLIFKMADKLKINNLCSKSLETIKAEFIDKNKQTEIGFEFDVKSNTAHHGKTFRNR